MKRLLIVLVWCATANAAPQLVFKDASGRVLTAKDLEHATGTLRWEIVGADSVPAEAIRLHDEGRAAGGKGDYARAHQLFESARRLAPRWPYPIYDDAFSYLLEGDADRAEKRYEKVEELAPRGFFSYQRELDCLRQQRRGTLPAGFCRAYAMLEWASPSERLTALKDITSRYAGYAPAWLELSKSIPSARERLAMIERGLRCRADVDTHGALLIDKALALRDLGKRQEAIRILGTLALDPHASLGNAAMAKFALAQMMKQRRR